MPRKSTESVVAEVAPKSSPRCATPAIDSIMRQWKLAPNPYDDKAFDQPSYQRRQKVVKLAKQR